MNGGLKLKDWINKLVDKSLKFYLPYRGSEVSTYVKERPLREIFKAIQDAPPTAENLREIVCGRLYKTMDRLLEKGESERKARIRLVGKELINAIEDFVNLFYEEVFLKICEGKKSNARRYQNEIVDGYTFKLLPKIENEWEKEQERSR